MASAFDADIQNVLTHHDKPDAAKVMTAHEVYENAGTFAQAAIAPLDQILDNQTGAFPHRLWKQLGEQGYKGLIIPETYGGMGLGYLALTAATLQISKASGSVGLSFIADQALCTHQIIKHGTDEQKAKYLPALASGDKVGALAMSEPEAGSDVMSMRTRAEPAERNGVKGYVINGTKTWITNGGRNDETTGAPLTADVLVLYAVTNTAPKKLTAFLVDGGTEGFNAVRKIEKECLPGSETWELEFNDVFVPEDAILGTVNKGANVLMAGLNAERLILGAGALGLAIAAFDDAVDYTTQRRQFGGPIAYNQDVAFDLADIYSEITGALANMFTAAAMADNGIDLTNGMAASVFLEASQIATRAAEQNVYYHGGNGQTIDYRAGLIKRDASLYRVGGGSEHVRMLRIAEQVIPGYREHVIEERNLRALAKELSDKFKGATRLVSGELEVFGKTNPGGEFLLVPVDRKP
ncbi:MAG: isovaleryl-CoA dehydrogenase [Alphaproteobacteria bacterium]|nr:isovaleryl-CoA dehydrogenase [Alphaproteobacteria bacterium]